MFYNNKVLYLTVPESLAGKIYNLLDNRAFGWKCSDEYANISFDSNEIIVCDVPEHMFEYLYDKAREICFVELGRHDVTAKTVEMVRRHYP